MSNWGPICRAPQFGEEAGVLLETQSASSNTPNPRLCESSEEFRQFILYNAHIVYNIHQLLIYNTLTNTVQQVKYILDKNARQLASRNQN